MKKIATSAELRARAIAAMKDTWKVVLVLTCALNLTSYVITRLLSLLPERLALVLLLVVSVLSMVPVLGVTKGVLEQLRGKALTFDCIRSILPHAKQLIVFFLWEMLCIIGWCVVGMGVQLLGAIIGALIDPSGLTTAMFFLAGAVVMVVLMIRAALNYSMGNCLILDDPKAGARNALRRSKEMIRGYRWHYVKVILPVETCVMAVLLLNWLLQGVVPVWLNSLISTVLGAVTSATTHYFISVMYEELRKAKR